MKSFISLLLVTVFTLSAASASADVLLIDAITQAPANSEGGLPRPNSGQSMTQVRARFGEPKQEIPWVGEPPISRWVYGSFTVYFEYDKVIHSVTHK